MRTKPMRRLARESTPLHQAPVKPAIGIKSLLDNQQACRFIQLHVDLGRWKAVIVLASEGTSYEPVKCATLI